MGAEGGYRHHRRRIVRPHQVAGRHREVAGLARERRANGRVTELHSRIFDGGLLGFCAASRLATEDLSARTVASSACNLALALSYSSREITPASISLASRLRIDRELLAVAWSLATMSLPCLTAAMAFKQVRFSFAELRLQGT